MWIYWPTEWLKKSTCWRYTIPIEWIRANVHHLVIIIGWPFISRSWSHSGSYSFIYSPFLPLWASLDPDWFLLPYCKSYSGSTWGEKSLLHNYHSKSLSSYYIQNSQMISIPLLVLITYVLSAVEIWFPLSLIYRNCTLEGHPWFSNHQIQRILFYFSSLLFNQLNYLFLQILNSMMLFCPDFVCILG